MAKDTMLADAEDNEHPFSVLDQLLPFVVEKVIFARARVKFKNDQSLNNNQGFHINMIGWIFALIMILALDFLKNQIQDERHIRKLAATVTATTTVTITNTQTTTQSTAHTTDLPRKLPDCDFHVLYRGASALEPPFDVANSINLKQWQAAWQQLSELRVLIDSHRSCLMHQHGAEEFKSFLSDLEILVEKPLRYGCSTLQHLQVGLFEFKNIAIDQDYGPRAILSGLLRETEISIINNTLGTTITHLLPSWARQAPELRSKRCPGQDCFKIEETALDIAMLQIPIELLNGVRRVQSDTVIGRTNATKRAGSQTFGTMTPWGRVTKVPMPDFRLPDRLDHDQN
ncbi:hypothetical protein FHL15_009777 [Xylaria flabelliformis]|uniref:Uncharacterized protein n=1 Tax=Xylaria flabelliformis TaxID=2512241 RepID=A0A553HN07_9PEZI|nr:hypothetical protein FHL15_009777 [Xylaria flabelliformis]